MWNLKRKGANGRVQSHAASEGQERDFLPGASSLSNVASAECNGYWLMEFFCVAKET